MSTHSFWAVLLMKPENLSATEMDRTVRSVTFAHVADWLNSYVVKNHSDKETLREKWLTGKSPWAARAGWSLTAERVAKDAERLDLPAILDRIESEMADAAPEVQWTMNAGLAGIGIHHSKHRQRASIATIPSPKDAPHPLPQSGSTKWCVGKLQRNRNF